jgi:uridine nucleosidase
VRHCSCQCTDRSIQCDPEAAASIFSKPALAAKTTLIPLDITHQVLANDNITKMLYYGYNAPASPPQQPSAIRHLFHEILTFFTKTYSHEFAMNTGPPLHDPLAVAAAFVPTLFDDNNNERYKVYVVTEGDSSPISSERDATKAGQCGRTLVKLLGSGEEGVRIPRTLQVEEFWHMVDLSLEEAEKEGFRTEGFWSSGAVTEREF